VEVSEVCRLSFLWIWIWPTWTWHKKSSHTAMQTCSMQPCTILETCRWVERYIYYNNIIYEKEKGEDDDMMICFPPTGYPSPPTPHTHTQQPPARPTAHTAHSQRCRRHTHRATPRVVEYPCCVDAPTRRPHSSGLCSMLDARPFRRWRA